MLIHLQVSVTRVQWLKLWCFPFPHDYAHARADDHDVHARASLPDQNSYLRHDTPEILSSVEWSINLFSGKSFALESVKEAVPEANWFIQAN